MDRPLILRDRCILEQQVGAVAAVQACARASEAHVTTYGADDPRTLRQQHSEATALEGAQRFDEARALLQRTLQTWRRIGDDPEARALLLNSLGIVLEQLGEHDHAAQAYGDALALLSELPREQPDRLESIELNLGTLAIERGDPVAAERHYQRVIVSVTSRHRGDHLMLVHALWALGNALREQHRYPEARDTLQRAITMGEGLELGLSTLSRARLGLAHTLVESGLDPEAGRALAHSIAQTLETESPDHRDLIAEAKQLSAT